MSARPSDLKNFCRVYELPDRYPDGYCFNGGLPVVMKMVDWFKPWPPSMLDTPEGYRTWDDVVPMLKSFLRDKNYVKPGKKYLLVTDFDTSFVFSKDCSP